MTDPTDDFWGALLAGAGATAVPRRPAADPAGDPAGTGRREDPVPDPEALRRQAKTLSVPLGTLLLVAHGRVLEALSGETDTTAGYVAEAGARPVPCPLPGTGGGAASWRDVAELTHRTATAVAARHGTAPSRPGLFETAVAAPGVRPEPGGSAILAVALAERDAELVLETAYRRDAVGDEYAERLAGYHLAALARLADADPDAGCEAGSLLGPDELRLQLEGMAGPAVARPDRPVHELVEDRVRAHPDAVAVECGGTAWTYAELNARANRLARMLHERGVSREDVVGVVTERNLEWAAAVLAVLKAGGVYLPIEPHFPAERIGRTLGRAGCRLVLTERPVPPTLADALTALPGVHTLALDDARLADLADGDLGVRITGDQLAYIYFTSGSTGEPKGAMCEHAGMVNHVLAKIEDLGVAEGGVVAQTAPQCFDISLWQLVAAWVAGGRTLIVEQDVILDVGRFAETVREHRVDVLQLVPSYLEALLGRLERSGETLPDLRCLSATGEALKAELVQRWFAAMPGVALVNAYGLTETCDDTNHAVLTGPVSNGRVPLGPPIANVRVHVVDEALRPVPLGAPGEIVFSGVCVGRGYVNDPERTAAAFVPDPHRAGERLYRSGDRGRWGADGSLEFLGRRDSQVKIRGFRIEIGEIDNALLRVPGVRDGAVVVCERPGGSAHLVAFYAADSALDDGELKGRLGASLPEYMVPTAVHHRERLPLTANSKIDRKALTALALELDAVPERADAAPLTPAQRRLAEIWAGVLGVPAGRFGPGDSFLDHGGTSLSAVKVVAALDRAVSLREVVRTPVLADLAALLEARAVPIP